MTARSLARHLLRLALLAIGGAAAPGWAEAPAPVQHLEHGVDRPWLGDLDGMVERRQIRILVVPSRTFYFVDKGTQRGLSYDSGRAFEDEVNQKLGKKALRVEVVFVPGSRDEILPALIQGRGDIAAANLTITPERKQWVDFSAPLWTGVDEIVVTGPASSAVHGLDDLAGQEVFVRLSSSYFQSLWHLNEWFGKTGKAPVRVKQAPEQLEDEDILEMLNAGSDPVRDRRQLQSRVLGADPAQDRAAPERDGAQPRRGGVGVPQGQPEARGSRGRLRQAPRQGHGLR
jgi:ABC-type amino acid transport substrate-binding protein